MNTTSLEAAQQGRDILRSILELFHEGVDDAIDAAESGDTETTFITTAHFLNCVRDLTDSVRQVVLMIASAETDFSQEDALDNLRVRISAVGETHRVVNDSRLARINELLHTIDPNLQSNQEGE